MTQARLGIKVVLMRVERVPYMDQSGLHAMDDVIPSLGHRGGFLRSAESALLMPERINVITVLIYENFIFEGFESCLCWLKPYLEQEKPGDLAEEHRPGSPESTLFKLQ
ncbi:MAG: hypothetical protein NXI25_15085 [bacterium]|nr:hypothetical protein [bacterium]